MLLAVDAAYVRCIRYKKMSHNRYRNVVHEELVAQRRLIDHVLSGAMKRLLFVLRSSMLMDSTRSGSLFKG